MDEKDRKRGEDDWFREHERHLLEVARAARQQRERERATRESAEELENIKQLHWMKCPKCGHDMKVEDISGVRVDRCTFCEGLYLDAGELEELFAKKQADRRGIFRSILGI